MPPAIAAHDLAFAWPGGDAVFDGLDFTAGPGRTALIGANGSGKTTLLRLLAGELAPARGSVRVSGGLGYLRQDLTLDARLPVDEVLGIARVRRAVRAIERGQVTPANLADVGEDWDAEQRARAVLDRLGLRHVGLDRRVGEVSGGEAVLLGLAAQFLRRPGVLLLDEPTNNLDLAARGRLADAVAAWPGVLVMVSHDRDLLAGAGQVAELRDGELSWYGGNLAGYEEAAAARQEAAARAVRSAVARVRRERRDLIETRTKLERRARYGRGLGERRGEDRTAASERRRRAEVTAGKQRGLHTGRLDDAKERLAAAEQAVRADPVLRIDLPATAVPAGRTVLTAAGARLRGGALVELRVRGPERVALLGPNGAGKTTLLETIAGLLAPVAGTVTPAVPVRYLPQRLDVLDDAATIAGNVAAFAPGACPHAIRERLARLEFRGERADQVAGTLSGGERFRAALAALLLAEPAPQLLLLDEPTNSLDLASVRQLGEALASYRGALIVASHDQPFLRGAGITRWLRLDGALTEILPL